MHRSPEPTAGTGLFIVIEGLDGSGISTQIAVLRGWLSGRGITVEGTKEPSRGPFGAVIRQAIEGRLTLDDRTLALAFAADRVDHLYNPVNGIRQHLASGRWVISDRYVLSSLAYQGAAGLDPEWLLEINAFALEPDVTIFIDTPPDICIQRIHQRSSSLELYDDVQQLREIHRLYGTWLARGRLTGHLVTVNGSQNEGDVSRDLQNELEAWLKRRPAKS